MRFLMVGRPPCLAPKNIRAVVDDLKMGGVHTAADAAKVVDFFAFRNRPVGEFVGEPMDVKLLPPASARHEPIAVPVVRTEPEPTPGIRFRFRARR